ncbi:hypothetical protein VaNZ11_005026, partial [Volvox africanus]
MLTTTATVKTTVAGGGSKRFQKFIPCAVEAHRRAEDEAGRREPGIRNPGNLELVYFLRAVKQLEENNERGRSGWAIGLHKAAQRIAQHPTRIRNPQQLKAVHGVGDFTSKLVADVLWREYPPAEPDSEEEKLEEELRQATMTAGPAGGGGGGGDGGRGRG